MTTCKNSFFLVLKTSDNYKFHVLHVHHSSRASGTVDCLLINLLFTRIMNFEKKICFSKFQWW